MSSICNNILDFCLKRIKHYFLLSTVKSIYTVVKSNNNIWTETLWECKSIRIASSIDQPSSSLSMPSVLIFGSHRLSPLLSNLFFFPSHFFFLMSSSTRATLGYPLDHSFSSLMGDYLMQLLNACVHGIIDMDTYIQMRKKTLIIEMRMKSQFITRFLL